MTKQQTSQSAENSSYRSDMWVRLGWIWNLLFYVSLVVPTVFAWNDSDTTATGQRNIIILVGVTIVWHMVGAILLPRRFPKLIRHPIAMSVVMVGILVFWYLLVSINPDFFFTLMGLYSQVFILLPPTVAIPGSVLITTMVAYLQITADGSPFSLNNPIFLTYGLMAVVAILVAMWLNAIINQSVERRELIQKLEKSQDELATAERRAGILAERQRLAHEIHDTIAQGFISIIMHLEAADQALPDDTKTVQTHLAYAQSTARDSLQQARRVVDNLRPESLEGRTLPEAIERAAAKWSEQTGITVQTQSTGDILALHPDAEVTLLRATQEALNNVRKHASASSVDITLSYMGDCVILDVQDNGIGVNGDEKKNSAESGGFGLVAMRQRVAQFNGSVTLESDPGEGTTLMVEIPVREGDN